MNTRIRSFAFSAVMGVSFTVLAGPAAADGDAGKGQQVFQQCAACHSIQPGQTLMGPSLAGVVDREAGSVAGFNYSDALSSASFAWTEERLDSYIADPSGDLPGNRMPFAGMSNGEERRDVIAYLKTLSSQQ